jgi:AraC-like DNA-binding protein
VSYSGHSRFRRLRASGVLPHHQHAEAYIAVVLSGGYEEAGDRGCFRVKPGDVLLHIPFESHVNRYEPRGADLITLELAASATITEAVATLPDADEIVRMAECDPREATAEVLRVMQPAKRSVDDWPQKLATALEQNLHLRLGDWARELGLADATISRGFQKVFGITPSAFRVRQRARAALRLAVVGSGGLSEVALQAGFCDQAHMTRAVRAMTGRPPGAWRHVK